MPLPTIVEREEALITESAERQNEVFWCCGKALFRNNKDVTLYFIVYCLGIGPCNIYAALALILSTIEIAQYPGLWCVTFLYSVIYLLLTISYIFWVKMSRMLSLYLFVFALLSIIVGLCLDHFVSMPSHYFSQIWVGGFLYLVNFMWINHEL